MDPNYKPVRWASVTCHPWLPSEALQIAGARAFGARCDWQEGVDASRTFTDDVRSIGKTTNWTGKLPERAALIAALAQAPGPQNQVYFVNPLAVGFTPRHAAETVASLFDQDALIYLHSQVALYRKGDDMADFFAQVERDQKAATQRIYRERKSSDF